LDQETERLLRSGVESLGLALDDIQIRQLLQHLALLDKWNRVHNLTAIRDINDMVGKHVLDSLAVLDPIRKSVTQDNFSFADVGTGAGFPGLSLAIACPQWQITVIDSNLKKTGFIRHVTHVAALDNVTVVSSRVETMSQTFDGIISRAFSSLAEFAGLTKPIQRDNTVLWAMKGKYPQEELSDLQKPYIVEDTFSVAVPFCEGERHLLKIVKGRV